jgi:peptidoglycan hydrolase-like protein with peptidoglycan-binding domain
MRYREILEACWTGYRRVPGTAANTPGSCRKISEADLEEQNKNADQVRRIQQLLNKKYNANLDVDGVMGPLTLQSIKKFLPAAGTKAAPNPARNTAVQGYEKKLSTQDLEEDLRKWFKEKWVRFGPDGKIRGACARGDDSEGKPKCLPQSKAHSLGKKGRKYAAAKKRREDPNPERKGAAINVATKKK